MQLAWLRAEITGVNPDYIPVLQKATQLCRDFLSDVTGMEQTKAKIKSLNK